MSEVLLDTSFIISLLREQDVNHKKSLNLFASFVNQRIILIDHIYGETLTVLKNLKSYELINVFLNLISDLKVTIEFEHQNLLTEATEICLASKKLSYVDSLLIAISKSKKIKVLTFDKEILERLT